MTAPVFATLGYVRLNAYESEAMKELAAAAGLENAVIVNTCAVTAEAVRKAWQETGALAPRKPRRAGDRQGLRRADRARDLCRHARGHARHRQPRKDAGRHQAGMAAPDLIGSTEKIRASMTIMSVRETAGHLIDGRPPPRLCSGAERLRPSLHLLHHPLWPRYLRSVPVVVIDQIKRLVDRVARR